MEHNKMLKLALLQTEYAKAVDQALLANEALQLIERRRNKLRRQLVGLMGEGEVLEFFNEEPTDVPNPSGPNHV